MVKELYRLINKETGKTIAWFTDSEDYWHLNEWYNDSTIETVTVTELYVFKESW